jgi:hypothetical protein
LLGTGLQRISSDCELLIMFALPIVHDYTLLYGKMILLIMS